MFDGSDWTIRGRQGGRSRYIKRRSPYGPIRDLGELFIELAGSEAIGDYCGVRLAPYPRRVSGFDIGHGHDAIFARSHRTGIIRLYFGSAGGK
jgi:hypothetical protein